MSASDFWRFSLAFYVRPGVAQACLELQDQAGVDVNVMLFLLFLARHDRQTDDSDLAKIAGLTDCWRHAVVAPLRAMRRALKSPIGPYDPPITSTLRNEVKRVELAAERIQQETLERLAPLDTFRPATTDQECTARANLAAYARRLGWLPEEPLEAILNAFAQQSKTADGP